MLKLISETRRSRSLVSERDGFRCAACGASRRASAAVVPVLRSATMSRETLWPSSSLYRRVRPHRYGRRHRPRHRSNAAKAVRPRSIGTIWRRIAPASRLAASLSRRPVAQKRSRDAWAVPARPTPDRVARYCGDRSMPAASCSVTMTERRDYCPHPTSRPPDRELNKQSGGADSTRPRTFSGGGIRTRDVVRDFFLRNHLGHATRPAPLRPFNNQLKHPGPGRDLRRFHGVRPTI